MILFNGLRKIILSYAWLSWRADTQSLSQFPCDIATHEWLHLTGNLTLADLCVESCLDDDVPYLAVEMAIRGELTKEQTLLSSVADNGEYLFGNGQ